MKNIKKFQDYINEKKQDSDKKEIMSEKSIKENLEGGINYEIIANEIEKGNTNGLEPIEWDLEVNIQDWIKLDDEDIDMIATQIRNGELSGNDPIDWSLEFGGDEPILLPNEDDEDFNNTEEDNFDNIEEEEEVYDEDEDDEWEDTEDDDSDDEEERYMSDEDIENSYEGYKITEFNLNPKRENSEVRSGFLEIVFPNNEDKFDRWIMYSKDGKIAFDHWYPEKMYFELVDYIKAKISEDENKTSHIQKFESFNREDIANHLGIDKDEFEDSSDLGDMADSFNDANDSYEFAKMDAEELLDAYKDNNDMSQYFTPTISDEFEYNKEESLFNSVIKYYDEFFEKEYGYLDDFGSDLFDMALKDLIKKFLKNRK